MGYRKTAFSVGEYYHVYNRGVDKRIIFTSTYEYNRFMLLLYLCNTSHPLNLRDILNKGLSFDKLFGHARGKSLVSIGAYCLMPNHFHILVKEVTEGGITNFMRKAGTAYSSFFNHSHERTGALFQGRFRAEHVNKDRYLKYLFSYIHLNPVKLINSQWKKNGIRNRKRALAHLDAYHHSSFLDYKNENRAQSSILNRADFPDYFVSRSDFESHIDDFLSFQKKADAGDSENPRTVLG